MLFLPLLYIMDPDTIMVSRVVHLLSVINFTLLKNNFYAYIEYRQCSWGYHVQSSIFSTWRKQKFSLFLRKFLHTNLPQAGFEFRSLGPQANVLPIEPPLLVMLCIAFAFFLANGILKSSNIFCLTFFCVTIT